MENMHNIEHKYCQTTEKVRIEKRQTTKEKEDTLSTIRVKRRQKWRWVQSV
jgi:hypothetical protein